MLTPPENEPYYGLGIGIFEEGVYGHTGGIEGFVSHLSYDHNHDLVNVVLLNADADDPSFIATTIHSMIKAVIEKERN